MNYLISFLIGVLVGGIISVILLRRAIDKLDQRHIELDKQQLRLAETTDAPTVDQIVTEAGER